MRFVERIILFLPITCITSAPRSVGESYAMEQDVKKPTVKMLGLMALEDVINETGLSRSTIFAWKKVGKFPDRILFGARTMRWRVEDVKNWIESQIPQNALRL